jgi:hypothetical protein
LQSEQNKVIHGQKYKFYRTAATESAIIFRERYKYQQNNEATRCGTLCKEVRCPQAFDRHAVRGVGWLSFYKRVDYSEYERFIAECVFYVTRIKDNAKYDVGEEFDIPDEADSGVLKDEEIILYYGKKGELKHRSRQIELLFKQLKQNFPLKYFLGDNQNAIEIQIWVSMLANLLLTLVRSKVKRKWAFSNSKCNDILIQYKKSI